jgi:hypothetical protein
MNQSLRLNIEYSNIYTLSLGAMPEPVGAFHHPTTITDDEKLQQWPEKHNREMM